MRFEGSFKVPGHPGEVTERFTDVERMAGCVPGATLEGRDEEGNYLGTITVAFGPKRIKFAGKVQCEFDVSGHKGTLRGRGVADMRAARFSVTTTFAVDPDPASSEDRPLSLVRVVSDAELGGVLSAFAGAGGTAVGNVVMQQFAENMAREYGAAPTDPDAPAEAKPQEISAGKVMWSAVKGSAQRRLGKSRTAGTEDPQ